ncbi:MAG: hypothetical protein MUD13_07530 [Candidatus Nanopelagicales bacterium]|nr:hypothetical protein [Candidatus Nanopelagicales bacterium]
MSVIAAAISSPRLSWGIPMTAAVPTAADDHVLGPIDDEVVALLVAPGEVAGAEPLAVHDLRGRLGLAQVPLHHVGAPDRDLADLTLGDVVPVAVDQAHRAALDGRADRAGLAHLVRVVERGNRRGLGQAVALEDHRPERGLEAAEHLDGQRRATRGAHAQRGQVEAGPVGMLQQGDVHRGHAEHDGAAVALEHLERLGGIEAWQQGDRAAGEDRGVHPDGLAERVEQRQPAEDDVVRGEPDHVDAQLGVAGHVRVAELGALRAARGPRRVEHDGGVLVVTVDQRDRLVRHHGAEELRRHHADELRARLRRALAGLLGDAVPGEEDARLRVAQHVGELAGLVERVDRHDDPAGPEDAVVDDRHVRDVRQRHRHPVARRDAEGLQPARHPGRALGEHAVGDDRVVEDDRGLGGVRLGAAGEVGGRPCRRG